jgi:hypothetical protein
MNCIYILYIITDRTEVIDMTDGADVFTVPSVESLMTGVSQDLFKTSWNELITLRSKEETSPARKAWTAFMTSVAKTPYLARFSLNGTKLTPSERTLKDSACRNLASNIYFLLWHLRVKFPGVAQKATTDLADVQPPSLLENSNTLMSDLTKEISGAIRKLANTRKTAMTVKFKKEKVIFLNLINYII